MSRPSLEALLAELISIDATLRRGRASNAYSAAVCAASWDVSEAERTLSAAGVPAHPVPASTWTPPLPVLVRRTIAVRAGLEREVIRLADAEPGAGPTIAAIGPALHAVSKAVSHMLVAGAMSGESSMLGTGRDVALNSIADQLQTGLDQIDALGDRSTEVSVAGCHVQGAIDRLRLQAGAAPADAHTAAAAL